MAHHVEPMDVDCMDSDFDNKENTYHHSNALPCTEKGYEELDVSEINMKLRYSMTPASSPMSKSYTATFDNKNLGADDLLNFSHENPNLTRSLNSSLTKNDCVIKSLKSLPLQVLPTKEFIDGNSNTSVLRQLDSTLTNDVNITVTVDSGGSHDIDENLSLPSSSSSALHTPEATTPTKGIVKDGDSPIIRGLKSVLNMFRSSQSPIPPVDSDNTVTDEVLSLTNATILENTNPQASASTPIAAHRSKDGYVSKRSSPYKDSIVFNDDLEKELNWKDETTILFSQEKIPVHKLFLQQSKSTSAFKPDTNVDRLISEVELNLNSTVEYMDISCNESIVQDNMTTDLKTDNNKHEVDTAAESDSEFVDDLKTDNNKHEVNTAAESDSEFVDCETTFTKNESILVMSKAIEGNNDSLSKSHNLDLIQNIENALDHCPAVESDITSFSVMEGEIKTDATQSDYSKETAELLSELEKFEENIVPMSQISDVTVNLQDINMEKKEAIKQQCVTCDISNTGSVQEGIPKSLLETTKSQSQEKHLDVIEEAFKQIEITSTIKTQSEMHDIGTTCSMQENKLEISIETTEPGDKLLDLTEEILKQTEKDLTEEILKQTENNSYNKEDILELSVLEVAQNVTYVEHELKMITLDHDNAGVVTDVTVEPNTQVAKIDQKILDATIMEDLNKTEINGVSDATPMLFKNSQEVNPKEILDPVPFEMTSVLPSELSSETMNVLQTNKAADVPFPVIDLSNETLKTIPSETLNVMQDKSVKEKPNIQENEKPSDIPLPDEDDINKNIAVGAEVLTILGETIPAMPAVTTNVTSTHTKLDIADEDISKTVVEDKSRNDSVHTEFMKPNSSKNGELQSPEVLVAINTESKLLETILDTNIENNCILPKLHDVSPLEGVVLIPDTVLTLDNVDSLDTCSNPNESQSHDGDITSNLTLPEIGLKTSSNPSDLGHTNETIGNDSDTNTFDVTKDKHEQTLNKTQEAESMAILLNQSLNQAHDLPDLVNQTINITDEIVAKETTAKDMANSKQNRQNIDMGNFKVVDDLETPLETKSKDETLDFNPKLKTEFEKLLNNTATVLDKTMNNGNQSTNFILANETSEIVLENNPPHSIKIDENWPTESVQVTENVTVENEIVVSQNNSPYVSLMAHEKNIEKIENQFIPNTNISSSPPISSKGYNFNFDEMDDPFASKTKIRMSPTRDTTNSTLPENMIVVPKKLVGNRRKSQPSERKKQAAIKKKFNKSYDAAMECVKDEEINCESSKTKLVKETDPIRITKSFDTTQIVQEETKVELNKCKENLEIDFNIPERLSETTMEIESSNDSIATVSRETKNTSSSEQSVYYSAGASSTESCPPKNVFNLPEIDDINFNPFATKSKMRRSPPLDLQVENQFATTPKIRSSPEILILHPEPEPEDTVIYNANLTQAIDDIDSDDKMETELMEKDSSANISNNTSITATNSQNITVYDVNTEDEDTVEGPFLEIDDVVVDKMSAFDVDDTDMIQFNDLPAQECDDNLEGGELFIDAEAYEFLLNQNPRNFVTDSGKESLFLKFDPLFAKRVSSDEVLATPSNIEKKQSTPAKSTRPLLKNEASPIAGPSTLNITYEGDNNISQESNEDANITVAKPMMVVTPAVNPDVTQRSKSITPNRSNRRSITFTSPAIAVIDRLLSMSANNSLLGQDTTIILANREQTETDLAFTELRELLAEKEISVYNLRSESKDLKDRLASMETQVRVLEANGQVKLNKINALNERLTDMTKTNKSMAAVVEEYERTIASLISETEQDKKRNAEERLRLINERDEQTAHLASMEVSFSDIHSKYEKSKQVIFACKANEEKYKKTIKDFEENVAKMQANYDMLRNHATSKLNHANQELEKINRTHEAEVLKLNAMIKRKCLHATSLEETLAQTTKANEELTAICDELINKVG